MKLPYYTRIALLGFAVYLPFVVLLNVAAALQLVGWGYPLVVACIGFGTALVILLVRPWGLVLGLAVGLFGIPVVFSSFAEDLSHPNSFGDFLYRPVFMFAGVILLLVGSSAGLVQHFRNRTSMDGPVLVTRAARVLLGIVAVLTVFSTIATFTDVDTVAPAARASASETITAKDNQYKTSTVHVKANQPSTLLVRNRDIIVHTFTIESLAVSVDIGPHGEKLVELDSPPTGSYTFHCTVPGHESMRGTLVVE